MGRCRRLASPRDDPSQSFLCKSFQVAFPSLPDEKEFLQPEGGQLGLKPPTASRKVDSEGTEAVSMRESEGNFFATPGPHPVRATPSLR